jgi:TIR domain
VGTVFISHSEKDLGLVDEIIRGLEKAGYRTWYFERDVLPGTSYLVQIHDAVDQCDAVVLVVSTNSISSDQTTKEVVGAFERRKPFLPSVHEDPSLAFRILQKMPHRIGELDS